MADIVTEKNINGIKTTSSPIAVHESEVDEKFIPKGAIAFFVVLVFICAAIWYSVYYIAMMRQ